MLVRIYAYLTAVAALIVLGVEILDLVLQFTFKGLLIQNCVNIISGQNVTVTTFVNGSRVTRPLTSSEIQDDCNSAWNNGVYQDIAWLLVAGGEYATTSTRTSMAMPYTGLLGSTWVLLLSNHLCISPTARGSDHEPFSSPFRSLSNEPAESIRIQQLVRSHTLALSNAN